MKNIMIFFALVIVAWRCSPGEAEIETPVARSWYSITCYSSNGTVLLESNSQEHPHLGTVSKYAWQNLDGAHYNTDLRCTATEQPPKEVV